MRRRWHGITLVVLSITGLGSPGLARLHYAFNPPTPIEAPAAWKTVAVGTVASSQLPPAFVQEPPGEALVKVLSGYLGSTGDRPFRLDVREVLARSTEKRNEFVLGLSVDFVLVGPQGEKRLRLEHSLTFFTLSGRDITQVYGRLVDDLVYRLLIHPEALAFLGAPAETDPPDPALRQPKKRAIDLGPLLQLPETEPGVLSSGRILWGRKELSTYASAVIMLGTMKGVFAQYKTRKARSGFDIGYRMNTGIGVGRAEDMTMFGITADTAMEIGYLGVKRDEKGYVIRPGFSFLAVPELELTLYLTNFPGGSGMLSIIMMRLGITPQVDVPLGRYFGASLGIFLGMNLSVVNMPAQSYGGYTIEADSINNGPNFMWYPTGDLYIQTSSGRISLGMAFQQAVSAVKSGGSSILDTFKNPMIVLTYEDQFGRGVAFKKTNVVAGGVGLHSKERALAIPQSAFVDSHGHPVEIHRDDHATVYHKGSTTPTAATMSPTPIPPSPAAVAVTPAPPSPTGAGSPPATPAAATAFDGRWFLAPPTGTPPLKPATVEVLQRTTAEVFQGSSLSLIAPQESEQALAALGVQVIDNTNIPDVVAGLGARHALLINVTQGTGEVTLTLTHHDVAGGSQRSVSGTGKRVALLRLLREKLTELLQPPAPPLPLAPPPEASGQPSPPATATQPAPTLTPGGADGSSDASAPATEASSPEATAFAELDAPPVAASETATAVTAPVPPPVPLYTRWWLWTAVGVAAVVLALGIGLGVAQPWDDHLPSTDLGSFHIPTHD